jgi:hypothetical protein
MILWSFSLNIELIKYLGGGRWVWNQFIFLSFPLQNLCYSSEAISKCLLIQFQNYRFISLDVNILSCNWVSVDRVWMVIRFIGHLKSSWLHFTNHCHRMKIVLIKGSLLYLVTSSNSGCSSAPVLMSSQPSGHFTTGGLLPVSSSWRQAPWDSRPEIFFQLNPCGHSPYVTSSLWREVGFLSYEYAWPFVKCMYHTYSMLLKSPLSVQALQYMSCGCMPMRLLLYVSVL